MDDALGNVAKTELGITRKKSNDSIMASLNPTMKLKISERTCGIDKKVRYYTSINRAPEINDENLIKYATNDSGMRIEQIASVYRSLITQVQELVCNGHSVQLGNMGTLYFKIHAKISEEQADAGGSAVKSKRIGFRASKTLRQKLQTVNFVSETE